MALPVHRRDVIHLFEKSPKLKASANVKKKDNNEQQDKVKISTKAKKNQIIKQAKETVIKRIKETR
jgi:hypothetical protein